MNAKPVFGCEHEFVGRERKLETIIAAAHAGHALAILAAPGVGASELLRQAYDELCRSESIIPFHFELKRSDRDATRAAKRFAYEFLVQSIAWARRDALLSDLRPSLDEIARLAPAEFAWVDGAVEAVLTGDDISTFLAMPTRARRKVAVLVDGVERIISLREGREFLDNLTAIHGVSVITSGARRLMYGRSRSTQMRLEALPFAECAKAIERLAAGYHIEITDATRDLIVVQTDGSLAIADRLLAEAADHDTPLTDFVAVERAYTDSLFGGGIARYLRGRILRALPQAVDRNDVVRLLRENLGAEGARLSMRQWRREMRDVDDAAFGRLIRYLHVAEVISAGDGTVNMAATSRTIRDFIEARALILKSPTNRAAIVGRTMLHNVGRAQRLMTEFYRSNASIGVRDLLDSFEGQVIVRATVDYGPFKRQLKGRDDDALLTALRESPDTIELPRIAYTADAAAFYPPLAEMCDRDRAAVGLAETGEAWFVAEIDSKLEADAATAEFWCDRLEMAAANSGFERYQLWLIAPEGFTDDALDVLAERDAIGSSRRQTELLRQLLSSPAATSETITTEYSLTIEMGDEGELIAARNFSEIAEKHGIPTKASTQIKTALVEALINAAEHSLSPDRQVDLQFAVSPDAITITVTNRGLRLTSNMLSQAESPSERRGWGLKLIQELMDDVHLEPTDDGTRLVMVKRFSPTT